MNLPLPESNRTDEPEEIHNAGLWYDKFFDRWNEAFDGLLKDKKDGNDAKAEWVQKACGLCGDPNTLKEQQQRLAALVDACNGQLRFFRTDGRFVTGLGREHPVENGFAWHHTLGVPYLPASSVKGVLRAWARESCAKEEDIRRIFGSDNTKRPHVGSVAILDALPIAAVQLDPDVMTPHYAPYYQDETNETAPADWHNPTPIPFLTVASGQTFAFAVLPRRARDAQDQADCHTVLDWLKDALIWLGAGAKSNVGYGRFAYDQRATEAASEEARTRREQQQRQARLKEKLRDLSPLAQELERAIGDGRWEQDKNAFAQSWVIEVWLDKLEADPQPDAAQRFGALIRTHFPGLMENPEKMTGKKQDKPAFKNRQREIARRVNKLLQ